jgi:hypothetical protein
MLIEVGTLRNYQSNRLPHHDHREGGTVMMAPKFVNVMRLPDGRLAVLPQRSFYRQDRGLARHHLRMRATPVYTGILPDIAVGFVRGYYVALSTYTKNLPKPFISPHVVYEISARDEGP